MSFRHANISIFVPHLGCPNQCSFCNQSYITGKSHQPTAEDIHNAVKIALDSLKDNSHHAEVAFFGGSFTAIERDYMLMLLDTAYYYVKNGLIKGIRLSTRPDKIDNEVLELLKSKGVTAIELGAQSINDEVLRINRRGHTASDVIKSSKLIKSYGIELGLQMMTGLYGDSTSGAIDTAEEIIKLCPDTVRIYPTIVLKNTYLENLFISGLYNPQSLDSATELCADLLVKFQSANIPVIRLGLHSIENESYVAGPWHPAFKELCEGKIFLEKAKCLLDEKGKYTLFVSPNSISKMIGQSKRNIDYLNSIGYECKVVAEPNLKSYEVSAVKGK